MLMSTCKYTFTSSAVVSNTNKNSLSRNISESLNSLGVSQRITLLKESINLS